MDEIEVGNEPRRGHLLQRDGIAGVDDDNVICQGEEIAVAVDANAGAGILEYGVVANRTGEINITGRIADPAVAVVIN